MRKWIGSFGLLCLILAMNTFSVAAEEIVIKSRLFKGTKEAGQAASEVVISSFSEPFLFPAHPSYLEKENQDISNLRNELNTIYQLRDVDHLVSTDMIWDGKKRSLNETILLGEFIYPINIFPEILSKNDIKLRIEISKIQGDEVSLTSEKAILDKKNRSGLFLETEKLIVSNGYMKQLLDTEIITRFDEPVVLGFPSNGNPYFLSLLITKRSSDDTSQKAISGEGTEINILPSPQAFFEVTPVYPENCKEKKIEGEAILAVNADKAGTVTNVQVLKSAHPDLDEAAIEAFKKWKYEPVIKKGKAVPVVFAVKVNFKLGEQAQSTKAALNTDEEEKLDKILKQCAEYCEKLVGASLFFVCEEKIEEKIYRPGGGIIVGSADADQITIYHDERRPRLTEKNTYLYDYQLIKKGEKIEESRILLEENGKKRNEKNAPLKTKRFQSEKSVFGPVGLLSREWQANYDYKIARDETIKGRETFVIEAKPKIKIEKKPNYGKIWIDKKDFSILRIRIEQESLAGYDDFEKEAKKIKVKPIITIIHDYEVEKNGLMFPSKTTFREEYTGRGMGRSRRSELSIIYDKYRFFIVETEVKYKSP